MRDLYAQKGLKHHKECPAGCVSNPPCKKCTNNFQSPVVSQNRGT